MFDKYIWILSDESTQETKSNFIFFVQALSSAIRWPCISDEDLTGTVWSSAILNAIQMSNFPEDQTGLNQEPRRTPCNCFVLF